MLQITAKDLIERLSEPGQGEPFKALTLYACSAQQLQTICRLLLTFPVLVKNLTTLTLSYNAFNGSLPSELYELTALESLDLSHNELTRISSNIGQLTNLRSLSLADNNLAGLPSGLGRLKHLERLTLWGCPASMQLPYEVAGLQGAQIS